MKKTLLAASIAALAFSPAAMAQNYQMEGGAHYMYSDFADGMMETDHFGFDFKYHFDVVSTAGHPLAEAAFLERSNNIFAGYRYSDSDIDLGLNKVSGKNHLFNFGGEAFIEDFYVSANIGLNQMKIEGEKDDTTDVGLRVGYLPMDGFLVTLGYDKDDSSDIDIVSLGAKIVTPLEGEMAVNIEAEIGVADDDDDTVVYEIGGDLYFNHAMSAGLKLGGIDASGAKTEIELRGRYFVTPLVSVNAFYIDNLEYVKKSNAFGIGANMRF